MKKSAWTKLTAALVLTFSAGFVDAVGWISLYRVFTAQMSGNVVLVAVHLAAGENERAWLQLDAIGMFVLGLVLTGVVIELGMRRKAVRIFTAALAIELLLLVGFAVLVSHYGRLPGTQGPHPAAAIYFMVGIVALAMGTQNTSLRMAGIISMFTTHITGALTSLSEEVVVAAFTLLETKKRHRAKGGIASDILQRHHGKALASITQSGLLLLGFFIGALGGATLSRPFGYGVALIVPISLLTAVGAFDWLVPLTEFPSPAERE